MSLAQSIASQAWFVLSPYLFVMATIMFVEFGVDYIGFAALIVV